MAHREFTKIKGERGGMSFSQFDGYTSEQAAKNARDKMAKKLTENGKTYDRINGSAYAGGTIFKTFKIINVHNKARKK